MAARECEIEMTLEILDEVAFLFVEQFDNLYGMLVDRTDVKRIRKSADDGEDGLFKVVASVFGNKLDDVFVGAANGAMDYIAYVDETWTPEDDEDRKRTLETEAFHLESLKAVLEIAEKNGLSVVGQIRDILLFVVGIAIGMITPPVAINLFVASGITGLPIERISKSVVPYLIGLVAVFLAIVFVPLLVPGLL